MLFGDQGLDALAGEGDHAGELGFIEDLVLGGGLDFDQLAAGGHDEIHVDVGAGIFFVAEVEEDFSVDDTDAYGGDEITERGGGQGTGFD